MRAPQVGRSHPPGAPEDPPGRRPQGEPGTFPEPPFSAADVLEWYRVRWQVGLVFKRFKSLAQLGHVPKHDDDSAKAWLYGKLLVALLMQYLFTG